MNPKFASVIESLEPAFQRLIQMDPVARNGYPGPCRREEFTFSRTASHIYMSGAATTSADASHSTAARAASTTKQLLLSGWRDTKLAKPWQPTQLLVRVEKWPKTLCLVLCSSPLRHASDRWISALSRKVTRLGNRSSRSIQRRFW